MVVAHEVCHVVSDETAPDTRCFFCYGRIENGTRIIQFQSQKVYHFECLPDMLVANEIESVLLHSLSGENMVVKGYCPKGPAHF